MSKFRSFFGFGKKAFDPMGSQPRFLHDLGNKSRGKSFALFVCLVTPYFLTNYLIDKTNMDVIRNGDERIAEFEEYRLQRNKRLAEKRANRAQHGHDDEEVVLHSKQVDLNKSSDANYKYVLIGGGTASYSAYKAIRKNDPQAKILIVTAEDHAPYQRPPLSKELWKNEDSPSGDAAPGGSSPSTKAPLSTDPSLTFKDWSGQYSSIFYEQESAYKNDNTTLVKGVSVTDLDVNNQRVTLQDGRSFSYDRCLLATGGSPREVIGSEKIPQHISTFRTLDDFKKLDQVASKKDSTVVVIGGSFLGTELAYALAQRNGPKVVQVFLEPEVLARNLPRYLSKRVRKVLQGVGVQLKPNLHVTSVEKKGNGVQIKMDNGETIDADYVITATGLYPNTELAEKAGLEIDPVNGGIVTNSELETRNNIFVAGDVLSYYDAVLGRRRSEHYEHASSTGKHAGMNMSAQAGQKKPYNHISMFWSDVGPVNFEAVGEINSNLNTYAVWDGVSVTQSGTPWSSAPAPYRNSGFGKGVVYYLRDNKVVGVLLWNLPGKIQDARNVLSQKKSVEVLHELKDKIKLSGK